jgi:hypothetical protein
MFIYNKMQKTSSDRAAAGAARRNQRGICHKRTQGGEPQAKELNHGFAEIAVHAKVTKEMLHKSLSLRSLRWLWLESFWIWMIRRYCGAGGPPQPKQEFATGQHRWAQTWEKLASRLFLLVAGRGKPMICAQTKAKIWVRSTRFTHRFANFLRLA